MGPIPAEAGGIQVDVTGKGAFKAIDRTMHGAGCARLSDVEADIVTVAVAAFQPPHIGSGLQAHKSAIEVRPCPLCKVFACVLAEHTAPCTELRNAVLIARDPFVGLRDAFVGQSDFEFPDCNRPARAADRPGAR